MREIVVALQQLGFVNPDSGEPWTLTTIHRDIQAIHTEWQRAAQKAIKKHKARQLAELAEVRRQAWHDNDMAAVLRAISLEMQLLGTEAPKVTQTQVTGKDGGPLQVENVKGYVNISPDDWDDKPTTADGDL